MSTAMHTAFHDSLKDALGVRYGEKAREAFKALSRESQDNVLKSALRAGGVSDDLIAQHWDDIVKDANRGAKTFRLWQTGQRIGGPRPSTGKAGSGKVCGTILGAAMALDTLAGNACAAEPPRPRRLLNCKATLVSYEQFIPVGYNSWVESTKPGFGTNGTSFDIQIYDNDIDELTNTVFNEKRGPYIPGYDLYTWQSYSVTNCKSVK